MAWLLNIYKCQRCSHIWTDEWSCTCDDDCPHCGARHMSPLDSHNLTTLIVPEGGRFVIFCSPETAEHTPDYQELASFATEEQAIAFDAENRP